MTISRTVRKLTGRLALRRKIDAEFLQNLSTQNPGALFPERLDKRASPFMLGAGGCIVGYTKMLVSMKLIARALIPRASGSPQQIETLLERLYVLGAPPSQGHPAIHA